MKPQQELQQEPQQNLQQRIGQQRVQHIVDSYLLAGNEPAAFDAYLHTLLSQHPDGLVELALVETLVRNWLTIPMQKGVPFLTTAQDQIEQWLQGLEHVSLTQSQFHHITGLDPKTAFDCLEQLQHQPAPAPTEMT
ncbi:hypothetical protein S7335_1871 [Synechococcus sp. PCC 7335]|uniref:hypothetical protein n=1 Tax=Synechococcus sp. (strain ATCC 29403 / PCC 7335) TaxID=91464 RepID=UPI00017EB412|nr:hypothetical protein [Synechococcus sp. PCC 7335]EDX84174.1 hypothetical protein S7335_1871 [Synechococcus sp. PCC 7335]